MSALHLVRLPLDPPRLLRFAFEHGIRQEDETLGYTLHAWLTALFGEAAPKPFRYFDTRREVLGYAREDAVTLMTRAEQHGSLGALAALDKAGVASKPMPAAWKVGQRLHLEVLVCPVSRKDNDEDDIYRRAIERLGDKAPNRCEVYRQWFLHQWQGAVKFEHVEMLGMRARVPLVRRARNGGSRLRQVERPQALFAGNVVIRDAERFQTLLARGIGRHRAFGFGMILLAPPR